MIIFAVDKRKFSIRYIINLILQTRFVKLFQTGFGSWKFVQNVCKSWYNFAGCVNREQESERSKSLEQRINPRGILLAQAAPFSLIAMVAIVSYLFLTNINVYGWVKTSMMFESVGYSFILGMGIIAAFIILSLAGFLRRRWIKELFIATLSATLSSFGVALVLYDLHLFALNIRHEDRVFFSIAGIIILIIGVIINGSRYEKRVSNRKTFTFTAIPSLIFVTVLISLSFLPV